MKKNIFIWFTAAVIIAALVFTGCSSPSGETTTTQGTVSVTSVSIEVESGRNNVLWVNNVDANPLFHDTIDLTAKINPTNATNKNVAWTSSDADETVATVSSPTGSSITVTAVGVGSVTITVTTEDGTETDDYVIEVKDVLTDYVAVTGVGIVGDNTLEFEKAGSVWTPVANKQLELEFTPTDATPLKVEWASDNTAVATVDNNGLVTPTGVAGTATITVTIDGESTITASVTVNVTVVAAPELKLAFIAKTGSTATPPTLPDPVGNIYTLPKLLNADGVATDGNFASATGLEDTILVYPDRLLTGDFKLKARVQITDASANSASKGLIIGAFKGHPEAGDFVTGGAGVGTATTGINLRSNGALRNYQSRSGEFLAATGLNTTVADKEEEFIYEVIRDSTGITTNVYISKNGDKLTQYSSTSPISYTTAGTYILADTPVYAGIALAAVAAKISQVELWDGDLDGSPVFYSGDSTAAPVAVKTVSITVDGNKGTPGAGNGTAATPAQYYVKQTAAGGSLQLTAAITPSYADVQGAKFYTSTVSEHPKDATISVDEAGAVTITGTGSKTIQAISNDEISASYYLTITVTGDYVPIEEFEIVSSAVTMLVGNTLNLSTDINFALISDPEIVWSTSDATTVIFVVDGENETTATGPTATIKGLKAGTNITITATATTTNGTTPTVKNATKAFAVTSAAGQLLQWKFDTLPTGWTDATNAASPYNVDTDYLNGLTLRAGNRSQMIRPTATAPSGSDFSDGCLQSGGGGIFATLGPVTGPFTVTVNYGNTGSNTPGRYPILLFATTSSITGNNPTAPDDPVTVTPAPPQADGSESTTDTYSYVYTYTPNPGEGMPDQVYVHFSASNGLRFFDIKVQF